MSCIHLKLIIMNTRGILIYKNGSNYCQSFSLFPVYIKPKPNNTVYVIFGVVLVQVVSRGEVVLVHCVAGVSRSVTLCLAYLVKWEKMTLRDAYHHMKQRR